MKARNEFRVLGGYHHAHPRGIRKRKPVRVLNNGRSPSAIYSAAGAYLKTK